MNGGRFVAGFVFAWLDRRREKKRQRKRDADAAGGEFFNLEDDEMGDAIKGAVKSKLVWLGLAQLAYSLFELWANGGLNAESASTAVAGALTILFRSLTTGSLADKAK